MMNYIPSSTDPMYLMVYKTVHQYIKDHETLPSDAKKALEHSDHINTLITNLFKQYRAAQDEQLKRKGTRISDATIKWAIESFCEVFIRGFEGHIEKRQMSEIEKYKAEHSGDEAKDMQSTLEGNSTGIYEDMGLIIPEDQQEQTENHIKEPIPEGRVITYGKN